MQGCLFFCSAYEVEIEKVLGLVVQLIRPRPLVIYQLHIYEQAYDLLSLILLHHSVQ